MWRSLWSAPLRGAFICDCVAFRGTKEKLSMTRLPSQEPAAAWLTDEFAIANCNLPSHSHNAGPAFNSRALKRIVIDDHLLRFSRYGSAVIWVINNQVR